MFSTELSRTHNAILCGPRYCSSNNISFPRVCCSSCEMRVSKAVSQLPYYHLTDSSLHRNGTRRGYELSRRGIVASCCGGSRGSTVQLDTIIYPPSPDPSSYGRSASRHSRPSGGTGRPSRPSSSTHSNNAGSAQSGHNPRYFEDSAYVARSFEELYDRDYWPVFARWDMDEYVFCKQRVVSYRLTQFYRLD